MRVLKVVAEGLTTSFRYPHFMQGVQPSFEMPPPATLYGHVCSTLGEQVDPAGVMFAIQFSYQASYEDLEHTQILSASSGNLPGTQIAKVLEGAVNPFERGQLFRPRLVLYLNRPEWLPRFASPRYAVALGRSQDLFTYTAVGVTELSRAPVAYFQHTLAPYSFARRTATGIVVLLPRFIEPGPHRRAHFGRYVVLHRRTRSADLLYSAGEPQSEWWVDPGAPVIDGEPLGLTFHTWVGDDDSELRLA